MPARETSPETAPERIGLWLIGARGAISTCLVYGLGGLAEELLPPVGLVTARPPFDRLPLAEYGAFVLGGHEVRTADLSRSASELVRQRILAPELVAACAPRAQAYDARVRPGLLDAADVGLADLHPESARLGGAAPRDQIAAVAADLREFRERERLARVVVVHLASTEAAREPRREWGRLADLDAALDAGATQPASLLYAYAAFSEGCAFVNFTPSAGASPPALRELARTEGVPHCGNDGKTGETLVKTALAPMFAHRGLRVHTWQGYNMLGNRDGEVLVDPLHKESKLRNKDEAVRSLLPDPELHTHVGIDYVPSLHDWKTAWDFVHFEGFLGVRMSLQFTWAGCDSALAAPLAIDLARLAELAARRGEGGVMAHTAAYFKSPLAGGTHDFHLQHQALLEYAERVLADRDEDERFPPRS